jgi:hypothetical protein
MRMSRLLKFCERNVWVSLDEGKNNARLSNNVNYTNCASV